MDGKFEWRSTPRCSSLRRLPELFGLKTRRVLGMYTAGNGLTLRLVEDSEIELDLLRDDGNRKSSDVLSG